MGNFVNGGGWTNTGSWGAGIIADRSGSTAHFAAVSLPADVNVTLDGARGANSAGQRDLLLLLRRSGRGVGVF